MVWMAWMGSAALADDNARLLGNNGAEAVQFAPAPASTPWMSWLPLLLAGGVAAGMVAWQRRQQAGGHVESPTVENVGRHSLGGSNLLHLVDVEDRAGRVRRLVVATGAQGVATLVADLGEEPGERRQVEGWNPTNQVNERRANPDRHAQERLAMERHERAERAVLDRNPNYNERSANLGDRNANYGDRNANYGDRNANYGDRNAERPVGYGERPERANQRADRPANPPDRNLDREERATNHHDRNWRTTEGEPPVQDRRTTQDRRAQALSLIDEVVGGATGPTNRAAANPPRTRAGLRA
jgi:hypothetical protein